MPSSSTTISPQHLQAISFGVKFGHFPDQRASV